jgi:hypothetical protein
MPNTSYSHNDPEDNNPNDAEFGNDSPLKPDDLKTEELLSFILTNSTDSAGRIAALQELSLNPRESVLQALCEHILINPDDSIRLPVAELISQIQPAGVIYNLCLAADQSQDKPIQKTALDLLSQMQNPVAEEFLKDFLKRIIQRPAKYPKNAIEQDDELAKLISGNISLFGSKELSIFLANEIFPKYPSDDVRIYIALDLPVNRFKECVEPLFRALDDKDFSVQLCAQTILMSLNDSEINNRIMRKLFP